MQRFLSAHVLDVLLISIKVHPIYYAWAKRFAYSMDDGVTKMMFETQNNRLSMYTNVSRNTLVQG